MYEKLENTRVMRISTDNWQPLKSTYFSFGGLAERIKKRVGKSGVDQHDYLLVVQIGFLLLLLSLLLSCNRHYTRLLGCHKNFNLPKLFVKILLSQCSHYVNVDIIAVYTQRQMMGCKNCEITVKREVYFRRDHCVGCTACV